MSDPVSYQLDGEVAVITVDNPPVNALSQAVRSGLAAAIDRFKNDAAAQAAVIVGAGRTFIAGADIREFGKPPQPPGLGEVVDAIEMTDKPVVVALHGTALGGGLEVALGCHYRVALDSARVGLPEVLLGILPGAGGTQRTPRLAGAEAAIDLITTGRHVKAAEAFDMGLIDEIAEGEDVRAAGVEYARRLVQEEAGVRRVRDLDERLSEARGNRALFDEARKAVAQKARGQIAPIKCVDAIQAAVELPFEEGLKRERELFEDLMRSDQREGLIHAFFAERKVAKIPELERGTAREIASVGVIGGGTMGAGITIAMMNAGLPVTMVERDDESLARGQANVERVLDGGVKRGKLTQQQKDEMVARLYTGTTEYQALGEADLVIEAVFEDMALKKDVFGKLEAICKQGAVLASNTSYLDINEIATATQRPQDVIGLHFFSPANIMRLLEVVVADKTSDDVVATGFALAKRLGKVAVRAGVCDGFIGNRILGRYLKAAYYMVEDGASPYDVDKAVVDFGLPMGPFAMGDLAGLDIGWATRKRKAATRDPRERYVEFADRICERGWFGQKTGRGFYIYEDGARKGTPDPEVLEIIANERERRQVRTREFTQDEIIRRYTAAMINEAAKVVGEGIALRPLDVDVTMLFGYGFPRWRGGPMKYADMRGLDAVLADVRDLEREDAYFWQPAELLVRLVDEGRNFDSLNEAG